MSGCNADLRCSYEQMLELRDMECVYFDVDLMTRGVAGERQPGESNGVSVLVRVPLLDTVPVSGEEQDLPLQTSGSCGKKVLLRVEDSGEGFVICNEHKMSIIQICVKLMCSPDPDECFLVDLHLVSLRSRHSSLCKSDRLVAFRSTCDITAPMPYDEASLARHRGTAGLKRVSTKSEAICCFTLSKACWQGSPSSCCSFFQ